MKAINQLVSFCRNARPYRGTFPDTVACVAVRKVTYDPITRWRVRIYVMQDDYRFSREASYYFMTHRGAVRFAKHLGDEHPQWSVIY